MKGIWDSGPEAGLHPGPAWAAERDRRAGPAMAPSAGSARKAMARVLVLAFF